jgi:mannose-6-phosphate isomerase-like protein (cupin superfamily)
MQHVNTGTNRKTFDLLMETRTSQAAMMNLRPGDQSDDEPSHDHSKSEQWLFVLSGGGEAVVGKKCSSLRRISITRGSLIVVEKGELHQFCNTGRRLLKTISFYIPPAYDSDGNPV